MNKKRTLVAGLILAGLGSMGWGLSNTPLEDVLKANGPINAIVQSGNRIFLGGNV